MYLHSRSHRYRQCLSGNYLLCLWILDWSTDRPARIEYMFDIDSAVRTALAQLAAARQALCAVDPATLGRDELLELMAALEIDARRRAAVRYAVVAELEARGIATEVGCSSTAVLLS